MPELLAAATIVGILVTIAWVVRRFWAGPANDQDQPEEKPLDHFERWDR